MSMSTGQTVAFFLFALPGGLFLMAAILPSDRWQTRLAHRSLVRVREWTVGELGRAPRRPWRAAVSGVTVPGLGGMVTAPLSGVACVWYRVRIRRTVERGETTRTVELFHRVAGDPVGVDDGTGRILVSSELLARGLLGGDPPGLIESPPLGDDTRAQLRTLKSRGLLAGEFEHPDALWVEEEFIRAGQRVLVLGRPHPWHGWTMLGSTGPLRCGVSLESLASLRKRSTGDVDY